jgi:hypothetical protein
MGETGGMPTALERAVDSLSDPDVSLPDALRRLLVVSRRIGADDLSRWIRSELDGYSNDADPPIYRNGTGLSIRLHFDGPFGSSAEMSVTKSELPEMLGAALDMVHFRQPVAELEALAQRDVGNDPHLNLPMAWVGMYRKFAGQSEVPRMDMMHLNHASVTIPQTYLNGILDRVKSTALDLALRLEDVSLEVGDTGGPTVGDEPRLADVVNVALTQLVAEPGSTVTVGDNNAIASGEGATVVQVQPGDIDGLLNAAGAYLDEEGVKALAQAIDQDGEEPKEATHKFLDRVKAGSYVLAAGVTTNGAYDGLVTLLKQAFPGKFG